MKTYKTHLRFVRAALIGLALSFFAAVNPSVHGGSHTWTGASPLNGHWSNAGNWLNNFAPAAGEASLTVVFPGFSQNNAPVQDIAGLKIDQMEIRGAYTFHGMGGARHTFRGTNDTVLAGANSTFAVDAGMTLENAPEIIVSNAVTLTIQSTINGAGELTKSGTGILKLGGTFANTYTGTTTVLGGDLHLSKPSGSNAVSGPLIIGGTRPPIAPTLVKLFGWHQINSSHPIVVRPNALLDLNGNLQIATSLVMFGGTVDSQPSGELRLTGSLTCLAQPLVPANILGEMNLGVGLSHLVTVTNGATLHLQAIVSGGGPGTTLTKSGQGRLVLRGANNYTSSTVVQQGRLHLFGSDVTLGDTLAGTTVSPNAVLSLEGADIGEEGLVLNGDVVTPVGAAVVQTDGNSSWAGPVALYGTNTFYVYTGYLNLSGQIGGPGGLRKVGDGICELSGTEPNFYQGSTHLEWGETRLNKTPNNGTFIRAIPGALIIGEKNQSASPDPAVVTLYRSSALNPLAPLTVRPGGVLMLNGHTQSLANVTLMEATIDANPGRFQLTDKLICQDTAWYAGFSAVNGTQVVAGANVTLDTQDGAELRLQCYLEGGPANHLKKIGSGSILAFGHSVNFSGDIDIQAGAVQCWNNSLTLGNATGKTIVRSGAGLGLKNARISGETLLVEAGASGPAALSADLMGGTPCSWGGPIVLNGDLELGAYFGYGDPAALLTVSGAISGSGGVTTAGFDPILLAGTVANTYAGPTTVENPLLLLAKTNGVSIRGALNIGKTGTTNASQVRLLSTNQIHDSSVVAIRDAGLLNLNNFSETIGSLEGQGDVMTQFATLTTGGNNFTTTFHGSVAGIGFTTLVKEGTGTMMLAGPNPYTGKTMVNAGKLLVHGSVGGPVLVSSSATLGGNGSVGNIASTNGIVSPGAGAGMLESKSVVLGPNSTFHVELNGLTPGFNCDQLNVTGTVQIANCQLLATVGAVTAVGDQFVLIKNDGTDAVSGTFLGLAEGAQLTLNGQKFAVSYQGGTGNDVVLTHVNTAPGLTSITASAFASEGGHVDLNGIISDPDAADEFSLVVNWGDGSAPQTFNLPAGTFNFHVDHTYPDDKPGAQASDSFTISYTLNDQSGPGAFGNLNTVIGNVAPTVNAGVDVAIAAGAPLNVSGSFTDPGADNWSGTVDYGDGTGSQPLTVGPGKSFSLNHAFPTNGAYTVTVKVSDDDTGSGVDTMEVAVGLQLKIGPAPGNPSQINVSWPAVFYGYSLQSTPSLPGGTNWAAVPTAPSLLNQDWTVTLPSSESEKFFRLAKP